MATAPISDNLDKLRINRLGAVEEHRR